MFDLSFAEIVLVVLVATIFIGPKELPTVIRGLSKAMRAARGMTRELRGMFDELAKESGIDDIKRDVKMIQGDDGNWYESYADVVPDHLPKATPQPKENPDERDA